MIVQLSLEPLFTSPASTVAAPAPSKVLLTFCATATGNVVSLIVAVAATATDSFPDASTTRKYSVCAPVSPQPYVSELVHGPVALLLIA